MHTIYVKPKPKIGQHFLTDLILAEEIVNALSSQNYKLLLEIGTGTGVLTQFLVLRKDFKLLTFEIDKEAIKYLKAHFDFKNHQFLEEDFLKFDLKQLGKQPIGIIGNFPYQISAPIFFKLFEHIDIVREIVCMVQKEVGLRIVSKEGNRIRGVLSVLFQTYYEIEYLYIVPPEVFNPPPKVDSIVIRLKRNTKTNLACSNKFFKNMIKTSFRHKRKKLKNNLKPYLSILKEEKDLILLDKRAEDLSVEDFIYISEKINRKSIK